MTTESKPVSQLRNFKRFPKPTTYPLAKHPQFILALHNDAFRDLSAPWCQVNEDNGGYMLVPQPNELEQVFAGFQEHLVIRQRQWLDESPRANNQSGAYKGDRNYKQILPYCAFVYESTLMGRAEDIKIGTYRRGSGAGEARLANNISVGWGGHIDMVDCVTHNSILDLPLTLERSLMREMDEEVKIINDAGQVVSAQSLESEFNGFIIDGTNPVGQLHVAFVSFFMVPDHFQLHSNEDELDTLQVYTVGELIEREKELKLESWTSILLKEIVARHRPTVPAEEYCPDNGLDEGAGNERFALAP